MRARRPSRRGVSLFFFIIAAVGVWSAQATGAQSLPFRVAPDASDFRRASHVSRTFQIIETDLVCDTHEVVVLTATRGGVARWSVAGRYAATPDQVFELSAAEGQTALIVTRCRGRDWYAAHGPFLWRPSGPVRFLHTDVARTIRLRTRAPAEVPLQFVDGDGRTLDGSCARHSDGLWECVGVPARVAGLAMWDAVEAVHWGVVSPARTPLETVSTQVSSWGQLVQLHGVAEHALADATISVVRQASSRVRQAMMRPFLRPAPLVVGRRVGSGSWWIAGEGSPVGRLLEVRAPSMTPRRVELGGVVAGTPSMPVPVTVVPGLTMSGQVRGPDRQPAASALVSLFEYDGAGEPGPEDSPRIRRWVADVVADEDGRFAIEGVEPKTYECVAVHQTLGMVMRTLRVDGRPVVMSLRPTPVVRGRVIAEGNPAIGVVVRAVPDRETFATALDPLPVTGSTGLTDAAGRFRLRLPAAGAGSVVIGGPPEGVARVAYPERARGDDVLDLGDIVIPPPADVLVRFRAGCTMHSVGPVGDLGMTVVRAGPGPVSDTYRLRIPETGLWWLEGSCPDSGLSVTRLIHIEDLADPPLVELSAPYTHDR